MKSKFYYEFVGIVSAPTIIMLIKIGRERKKKGGRQSEGEIEGETERTMPCEFVRSLFAIVYRNNTKPSSLPHTRSVLLVRLAAATARVTCLRSACQVRMFDKTFRRETEHTHTLPTCWELE